MANRAEEIKERYGDPYQVVKAIARAAVKGYDTLTDDDLFMCKWIGLYTHRHEKGYFMLRTKQPSGFISPEQLETLADIAEKQNKGYADITTRQDIQLHWVHYTQALEIIERLTSVGISTKGACGDVARNVVGCPVAGVSKDEILDAGPIAGQISDFFLGNSDYSNLPRKYKIAVSGCGTYCIHPEIQCVALVGIRRNVNGTIDCGFDLRVGGGLSTQAFISRRIGVFLKPNESLEVVRAITDIWRDAPGYRERRHHARIKYLIHDWARERFRDALESRLGRKLNDAPADYEEPLETYRDHVGVHAQKQAGLFYIGAPVLVGRIASAQMKRVAELCRRYGDGKTIRLTIRQNILLLNVPETNVEKVLAGLAEAGLSINAHPIRRSAVTCTGSEFCKLAITETKARTRQIVEYLERRVQLDSPIRLHITGCPNACAQYQIGHIGMMGSKAKIDTQTVDAYDIFVGGQVGSGARFGHVVMRRVAATECARRLEQVLLGFKRQRRGKESFNAWCKRVGDEALRRLLTEEPASPLSDIEPVPEMPKSDERGSQFIPPVSKR